MVRKGGPTGSSGAQPFNPPAKVPGMRVKSSWTLYTRPATSWILLSDPSWCRVEGKHHLTQACLDSWPTESWDIIKVVAACLIRSTGWFINKRNVFLTVLEAGSPRSECQCALALVRASSGVQADDFPWDLPTVEGRERKQVLWWLFLFFFKFIYFWGFPGGAVVESLPANAGDTGSSPGLGRSHMPRNNWAREPQLLSLRVWSLCSATREARAPRWRVTPACRN